MHPSLERGGAYAGCEGPRIAPVGLPTVASLFPDDFEIRFTDERVEELSYDGDADLVGITCSSRVAARAYRIADEFRRRGVRVALGGLHPSAMPEEAIGHCDAVVIGDAEGAVPRLAEDLRRGKLGQFYKSSPPPALERFPWPRRDLLAGKKYLTRNVVNATRGCPYSCGFCLTPTFTEGQFRARPVGEVVAEVESLPGKELIFVDDNIIGSRPHAKALFEALVPCRKWWFSQSVLHIAHDEELLKLAAKSGCKVLLVGFETLSRETLQQIGKPHYRPSKYEEAVRRLHDHGISVLGSFIAGFDSDDRTIFERILEFSIKASLDFIQCNPLAYYPGTPMFREACLQKRLRVPDWWLYDFPHVYKVFFEPKQMSAEDLESGVVWLMTEFYRFKSIWQRMWQTPVSLLWFYWLTNLGLRDIGVSTPVRGYNPACGEHD